MRHKLYEPVRAYLLGTLDDEHAAELEEKYFIDADFLSDVRETETQLIRDYLDERLSPSEKQLFAKRYLAVPDLAGRVEEVRREFGIHRQKGRERRFGGWRLALAGAVLSLLLAVIVVYWRSPAPNGNLQNGPPRLALPAFVVHLSPGVMKGPGAKPMSIAPPAGAVVRLELELPGQNSAGDYQARLMNIGANGERSRVWTSGVEQTTTAPGGAVLTVEIAGTLLPPGDYLVEIGTPSGDTMESYVFRVSR